MNGYGGLCSVAYGQPRYFALNVAGREDNRNPPIVAPAFPMNPTISKVLYLANIH